MSSTARIRQVESLDELGLVCDVIGGQITPRMARDDRRFQELWPRFEEDRTLMWLAEADGQIVGGALGFRPSGGAVTVRAIGVAPHARRQGAGRRLLAAVELAAMKLGATTISLGATDDARGFYQRLGYAGRGSLKQKGLPLPGRLLDACSTRGCAGWRLRWRVRCRSGITTSGLLCCDVCGRRSRSTTTLRRCSTVCGSSAASASKRL